MLEMRSLWRGAAVAAGALIISFAISAMAGDIVQDWDSVKAPAKNLPVSPCIILPSAVFS